MDRTTSNSMGSVMVTTSPSPINVERALSRFGRVEASNIGGLRMYRVVLSPTADGLLSWSFGSARSFAKNSPRVIDGDSDIGTVVERKLV